MPEQLDVNVWYPNWIPKLSQSFVSPRTNVQHSRSVSLVLSAPDHLGEYHSCFSVFVSGHPEACFFCFSVWREGHIEICLPFHGSPCFIILDPRDLFFTASSAGPCRGLPSMILLFILQIVRPPRSVLPTLAAKGHLSLSVLEIEDRVAVFPYKACQASGPRCLEMFLPVPY